MRNWNLWFFQWGIIATVCFYSTYEELKRPVRPVFLPHYPLVFTVPMRNWNTRGCPRNCPFCIVFLQYLWGIETDWKTCRNAEYNEVFTVPMRNWNVKIFACCWVRLSGFYSTYEELKPVDAAVRVSPVPSFYSTYEELKPIALLVINCCISCFYSTYEELKLLCAEEGFRFQAWFLQYLWGIETFYFCTSFNPHNSFYSTYEELKLGKDRWTAYLDFGFYSTYEELKPT